MKKFNYFLSCFATLIAVFMLAACGSSNSIEEEGGKDDPEQPGNQPSTPPTEELTFSMTAELVSADISTAQIKLVTENIKTYAYVVETTDVDLAVDIIFATGTQGQCKDGDNLVDIEKLQPNTEYVVIFAGVTVGDEPYSEIVKVNLTTQQITEEFKVFDQDYKSISIYFSYPKDKIQEGNVIKWGLGSFPLYYDNQIEFLETDATMMNQNDTQYHNYITGPTTWVLNEENSYANGKSDLETTYYDPIVPGEPLYFMLGEYMYDTNNHWGWGNGYYAPMFDDTNFYTDLYTSGSFPDQTKYWYGYYRREYVQTKKPGRMSANSKPEVTMNLTPMGGTITVTPPEGIVSYCVGLMDSGTLAQLMPKLNNDANHLQWFITSYYAFMKGVSQSFIGTQTFRLEDAYYMNQNTSYTLYVVAMGDEDGTKQHYSKYSFVLPKPQKPAPTAVVTGIKNPNGADSCDEVWFNLKCTSGNAIKAKYIANYDREWAAMLNNYIKQGYSEQEAMDTMISIYGASLTEDELTMLNSAEGINMNFYTRPDANNVCGISVMNDEGTWGSAIDVMRSIKEPDAPRVESSLFEELQGEWIASTTITYQHYHFCNTPDDPNHRNNDNECANPDDSDEHNYIVVATKPIQSTVHIGPVGYEAKLPESVYQLFFDGSDLKTKEEVDAVYDQFKTAVDNFNSNVRGQNRILCQGFELEYDADKVSCDIPEHNERDVADGKVSANYATPYELFIADAKVYSAYNYESPIFDFGPKWYLEVAADGTVTAPFNTQYFSPMAQWCDYVYQFVGASNNASLPYHRNAEGSYVNGHFPVEISADKNTITIKPVSHTYNKTDDAGQVVGTITEDFYPQIAREFNGQYQFYSRIVAPIVLTRKGTAAAAQSSAVTPKSIVAPKLTELQKLYEYKPAKSYRSRTALPLTKSMEQMEVVELKLVTPEQIKQTKIESAERRYRRK